MQLFPILVVAVILAADSGLALSRDGGIGSWYSLLIAVGPVVGIMLFAAVSMRSCLRRLTRDRTLRAITAADRMMRNSRLMLLAVHATAVLFCGWLEAIRRVTGDLILVDELIAMLPPLAGVMGLWWLNYPMERRIREALLIRRLDMGKPVHHIPTRWQYVIQQARLNVLLLLAPIVLILTLSETINVGLARWGGEDLPEWAADAATFGVGLCVFLFAPLIACMILSVRPLGSGPLRDDMLEICSRHKVKVRQILLWRTDGLMINAAVMGLIGSVRFVLMTDALIEAMSREQVRAVMAHEIGHVRRHHMPWMILSLIAALLLAAVLISAPLAILEGLGVDFGGPELAWIDGAATAVAGAVGLLAFGWVSRRYERQADTFATQHLSEVGGVIDQVDEDIEARIAADIHDVGTNEAGAEQAGMDDQGAEDPPSVHQAERAPAPDRAGGTVPTSDRAGENHPGAGAITMEAVRAMNSALSAIANLNTVDPKRKSWRHGSIAWRQKYLTSIIGQPISGLEIDRVVRRLKIASAGILVLAVAGIVLLEVFGTEPEQDYAGEIEVMVNAGSVERADDVLGAFAR